MALIQCPECQQQISDQAPTCPHCGHPRGTITPPSMPPPSSPIVGRGVASPPGKTSPLSANIRWGLFALIGVGCFALIAGPREEDPEGKYGSSGMAGIMCEDFVKRRLTSPGSAKFPNVYSDEVRIDSLGAGRYIVRLYVDAQNSFGALLRSRFVCRITKIPGGTKWQLEDLTMER